MPPANAHQCHINATYQCPSELPFSVTHQCQSVPPNSVVYQCQSVPPISAISVPPHQCPSVPPISVHQCSLSVPITAYSLAHITEGEKSLIYKIL
ncbi:unnamed protein product [Staurois parvus]|uniref:Uncharacterized protein n=1 Tax=Staurois parvus TaxID=386267 RepID=A0ABN9AMD5_9NEOB|nr:unnamed protein product [Staurois parvus]